MSTNNQYQNIYDTSYLNNLPQEKYDLFLSLLDKIKCDQYDDMCELIKNNSINKKGECYTISIFGYKINKFTKIIIQSNIIKYVLVSNKKIIDKILHILFRVYIDDFKNKNILNNLRYGQCISYLDYINDTVTKIINAILELNFLDNEKINLIISLYKTYIECFYDNIVCDDSIYSCKHNNENCVLHIQDKEKKDIADIVVPLIIKTKNKSLMQEFFIQKKLQYPEVDVYVKIQELSKYYDIKDFTIDDNIILKIFGKSKREFKSYYGKTQYTSHLINKKLHIEIGNHIYIFVNNFDFVKHCYDLYLKQFEPKLKKISIKKVEFIEI
ncbi:MAG: hypothetical protein Edafosvirus20_7 [Edafosvirus sp.]|uniref:Uncharacterized protein n=1 Tax=Edafosvirus sp. TaxID=2487765 RepID=A0A3G4ZUN2_9VIRU|nr:MAG: hypothetical protein Edafosvirus20_7 [Edafosvirus sp.]